LRQESEAERAGRVAALVDATEGFHQIQRLQGLVRVLRRDLDQPLAEAEAS
jgi:hypothetical protein